MVTTMTYSHRVIFCSVILVDILNDDFTYACRDMYTAYLKKGEICKIKYIL